MADNLDHPGTAGELLLQMYKIKFYVDARFPRVAKQDLRDAAELAVENMVLESIEEHPLYDCAASASGTTDWMLYHVALWQDILVRQHGTYINGKPVAYPIKIVRRGRIDGYFIVRIVGLVDEDNILGRAHLGNYYNGPITIAMNKNWLNGELTFDYPTLPEIAGVMVHEMLHTFGLDHPESGHNGTFVGEMGNCFVKHFGEPNSEFDLFLM